MSATRNREPKKNQQPDENTPLVREKRLSTTRVTDLNPLYPFGTHYDPFKFSLFSFELPNILRTPAIAVREVEMKEMAPKKKGPTL